MKPKTGLAFFITLISAIALAVSLFLPFVEIYGKPYTYLHLFIDTASVLSSSIGYLIVIFVVLCILLILIIIFMFACKPIPLIVFNVLYFIVNMFLPGRIFGVFAEGAYGTVVFYIASALLLFGSIFMIVQKNRQKHLYNEIQKGIDDLHASNAAKKESESKPE